MLEVGQPSPPSTRVASVEVQLVDGPLALNPASVDGAHLHGRVVAEEVRGVAHRLPEDRQVGSQVRGAGVALPVAPVVHPAPVPVEPALQHGESLRTGKAKHDGGQPLGVRTATAERLELGTSLGIERHDRHALRALHVVVRVVFPDRVPPVPDAADQVLALLVEVERGVTILTVPRLLKAPLGKVQAEEEPVLLVPVGIRVLLRLLKERGHRVVAHADLVGPDPPDSPSDDAPPDTLGPPDEERVVVGGQRGHVPALGRDAHQI